MAGPPSATSATTVGGCTIEELCNGTVVSYACDYTVDIRGSDFEQAQQKILKHIDDCIIDLEIASQRKVEKLYIGKTYIHRRRAPRGFVPIDPKNPWTYKKGGIGSRWREHRNNDYGRDGMIVLVVIPREAVPSNAKPGLHQEDYTFALEQALLHHFMITNYDHRIANDSFATGGTDVHGSAAYALYMAFRLEDKEDAEGGTGLQNSSDSDSDVIFVQEYSTGQEDLTMHAERGIPAVQTHSRPLANVHTTPPTPPLHILPPAQTTESATPICMPESTTGSTHCTATGQDNIFEIQGSRPNLAGNTGSSVRFQYPLVSKTYEYEHPRPNRKREIPKRPQTPYVPSSDAYDFDNHSDSTDEHFDHCLTCNQDTHDHHGSTCTSWTDSANASCPAITHTRAKSKSHQSRETGSTSATTNSTSTHSITMTTSSSATSMHPTTSTYPINEQRPSTTRTHSTTISGTCPTTLVPSPLGAGNIATNSLQQLHTNIPPMLCFFIFVPWLTNHSNELHRPSKKRREE